MYRNADILVGMASIERTLRAAVADSGLSLKAVSDRTGIPYACVHQWVNDERRTLTVRTADKLATLFDLELRPKRQARKGR